jgi:hypothetical protein
MFGYTTLFSLKVEKILTFILPFLTYFAFRLTVTCLVCLKLTRFNSWNRVKEGEVRNAITFAALPFLEKAICKDQTKY